MITRIQVTTVFVSDQDKALDFYTNALGLTKKMDMPMGDFRWVEVVPDGAETTIALSLPFPGMSPGNPSGMIFDTNDIAGDVKRMKDKGVNFTEEPTPQPWGGIQAQFADPDGNTFMLVERTN